MITAKHAHLLSEGRIFFFLHRLRELTSFKLFSFIHHFLLNAFLNCRQFKLNEDNLLETKRKTMAV